MGREMGRYMRMEVWGGGQIAFYKWVCLCFRFYFARGEGMWGKGYG